jgi:hypothetical protein
MEKRLTTRQSQDNGPCIGNPIDALDQVSGVDWRRYVIKLVTVPAGKIAPTGDD